MGPERGGRRGGRSGGVCRSHAGRPAAPALPPRAEAAAGGGGGGGGGRAAHGAAAAAGWRSPACRLNRASEGGGGRRGGAEGREAKKGRQPGGEVSHLLLPLTGTASSALPSAGVPGWGGAPAPCRGSARPERAGNAAGAVRRVRTARAAGGQGRAAGAPRSGARDPSSSSKFVGGVVGRGFFGE